MATLHLLVQVIFIFILSSRGSNKSSCQMKVQCLRASAGLSLFTALYAFNRVALIDHNQLYVSKNIASHLDREKREDPQASRPYLELVFFFFIAAISRAYPEAIPPKRRQRYSQIFIPDIDSTSK